MKKALTYSLQVLFLITIISVSSCKKEDQTQTVSYNLSEYDAYLSTYYYGSGYTDNGTFDVTPVDVQNAFLTVGVPYDVSKVTTAKLSGLNAIATSGTLSDISDIKVYIKVAGANGDGVRIAHSGTLSGTSANALVLDGTDLKQFLNIESTVTVKITIKDGANDVYVKLSAGVIQATVKK